MRSRLGLLAVIALSGCGQALPTASPSASAPSAPSEPPYVVSCDESISRPECLDRAAVIAAFHPDKEVVSVTISLLNGERINFADGTSIIGIP